MRVYDHAACTEYCKDFTIALKMIDVIDKKQMYNSVITQKEYACKDWNCIISVFLMSFNVHFVFNGYACFMCISLKTASGFPWLFLGQGLAFFNENSLATLLLHMFGFKDCHWPHGSFVHCHDRVFCMRSKSQRFFCKQTVMLHNKPTTIAMSSACGTVSR